MPIDNRGHVDEMLSGVSVKFAQEQDMFIHNKVFPTYGVQQKSGEFLTFPPGWFLRNQVRERPLHDEPAQATYGLASGTYNTKEYALAAVLDDREKANATPPFDPASNHVEFLTENHMINAEILWADAHLKPGVWSTQLTGQTTAPVAGRQTSATHIMQWDQAASKPQRAVNELNEKLALTIGREGNVAVIGRAAWTYLLDHPDIIERIKYTSSEAVSKAIIANYLGLEDIFVPAATMNVAPELAPQIGDNKSLSFIANPKSLLVLYRNPRVGPKMMTAGLTLTWKGLLGAEGFTFPVYRDRLPRAWSDWFAVRSAFSYKVMAPDCGVYVDSIIA